jgi:hypothetical protein
MFDHLSAHGCFGPKPGALDFTCRVDTGQGQQRLHGIGEVDWPVQLWQPELHPKPFKQRQQHEDLVGTEGPFELTDDDRVEVTVRAGDRLEQERRLRP